jgi:hypothetical protein
MKNIAGFYDDYINYDEVYSAISTEFNNVTEFEVSQMKTKYGDSKTKRFLDKKYVTSKNVNHNIRRSENIIAADFETVVVDSKHYVFCSSICFIPNKNLKRNSKLIPEVEYEDNLRIEYFRSYIDTQELGSDLANIDELSSQVLLNFWNDLNYVVDNMITAKTKPIVYFHNMDKFDGVFILKLISLLLNNNLINVEDINVIQRNSVIYEIKVGKIRIRDSLHLLTGSLNKLAKTFLNESKKDIDIKFNYSSIVENILEI